MKIFEKILISFLTALVLMFFSSCAFAENKIEKVNVENYGKIQKKYFDKMRVFEAWKYTKGSPKVLIGVIDSGFDFYHPALKNKLMPGLFISNAYHGDSFEMTAHGTVVSGIIAAQPIEGNEVCGLAPDCNILTASQGTIENKLFKLLQNNSYGGNKIKSVKNFIKLVTRNGKEIKTFAMQWQDYISKSRASSIRYLADNNVKVINISEFLSSDLLPSGSKEFQKRLNDAVEYASKKDVVIVIGAGNNARKIKNYPGTNDTVLVVGATMLNDERWIESVKIKIFGVNTAQGSCWGPRLSVMAPVENLVICMPHEERFYSRDDGPMGKTQDKFKGQYVVQRVSGTSFAAPAVTSLVALVRSLRPDLSAKETIQIIKLGADDIGKKGYDIHTGYGRINFLKTLEIAKNWKKTSKSNSLIIPKSEDMNQYVRRQNYDY